MKTRVLLALHDANVGVLLSEYLRLRDYEAEFVPTSSEALSALSKRHFDFCLLGPMTSADAPQDKSAASAALTDLVRDVRDGNKVPIFALQPSFDKDAQLALYEAGADDCIVEPVLPEILICKMEALLKRQDRYEQTLPHVFDYPGVHFDSIRQTLQVGPQTHHLSTKENDVLLLLCRHENEVVERSRILKTVWKSDSYFKSRSLSVYINHLRSYIEPHSTLRIVPQRGRGYKFMPLP